MKTISLLAILLLFGCQQAIPEYSEKQIKNDKGEVKIVILNDNKLKIYKPFQLLKSEVSELNSTLKKGIDSLNTADKSNVKLDEYKIQYLRYITDSREKEVFVTCFCSDVIGENWKTEIIPTVGGGHCIIRGTINLTTKEFGFKAQEPM